MQLEGELPDAVKVGTGTAIFVLGWCVSPDGRIGSLEFVLDGRPQPVDSQAMPRLDPYEALHDARAYRSGFWGLVRIDRPPAEGAYALRLRATLEDGRVVEVELARIALAEPVEPVAARWPDDGGDARVAIAMATYDPPDDLLARQLDSIRSQSHENWVCVISDDCSRPERYQALQQAVGSDERFVLSRSARRLGFYGNFERALELVPRDAGYVAIADQDDDWRPGKLAALLDGLDEALLVYSDARVVSRDGELISETWWNRRHNNHGDLLSLLVANSVTGAASLLRRELLETALPFPPTSSTTSTTTGSVWSRSRSTGSRTCPSRCTTTSSTAPRRSGTNAPTGWFRCASGSPTSAGRASGCTCGGCTTSSISGGCGSSARCC